MIRYGMISYHIEFIKQRDTDATQILTISCGTKFRTVHLLAFTISS